MRQMIWMAMLAALPALAGCPAGGPSPGQLTSGQAFAVAVRQDGRTVPVRDHTVRLARRRFALVFAFGRLERVLVHASFEPTMFEAVAAGRPMASVLPLPHRTPPAPLFNPDRTLAVGDEAYQLWYYLGPAIHRFDEDGIREVGGGYVCRRTVRAYRPGPDQPARPITQVGPHALYIVLTDTDLDPGSKRRTQGQTERLKLVFR